MRQLFCKVFKSPNKHLSPMQCIINFLKEIQCSWFLEIFDLQVDYSQTIVLIIIGPITSMQGRPSPGSHDAFSPLFQISPLFSKHFQALWKIFICSRKDFHPSKFLMTFFSHRPQISNFPSYFSCFSTLPPPVSRKLLFPPTFKNFPTLF